MNAIVHHTYPTKSYLLFAFEYGKTRNGPGRCRILHCMLQFHTGENLHGISYTRKRDGPMIAVYANYFYDTSVIFSNSIITYREPQSCPVDNVISISSTSQCERCIHDIVSTSFTSMYYRVYIVHIVNTAIHEMNRNFGLFCLFVVG